MTTTIAITNRRNFAQETSIGDDCLSQTETRSAGTPRVYREARQYGVPGYDHRKKLHLNVDISAFLRILK